MISILDTRPKPLSAKWLLDHMNAPASREAMLDAVKEAYDITEAEALAMSAVDFRHAMERAMEASGLQEDDSEGKPQPRDGASPTR